VTNLALTLPGLKRGANSCGYFNTYYICLR
jgi:hypothetical protein